MSNDGSVNAWVYPVQPRVYSPEPVQAVSISERVTTTNGEAGRTEEAEGARSRAATPREGTSDEEGERGMEDTAGDGAGAGTAESEVVPEELPAEAEGDRTAGTDGSDEVMEEHGETGSKDISMAEETEPKPSTAPSRQPTPPRPNQSSTPVPFIDNETRRSKQLKRFRHSVCHSASLLSLSFDPLGRYVPALNPL